MTEITSGNSFAVVEHEVKSVSPPRRHGGTEHPRIVSQYVIRGAGFSLCGFLVALLPLCGMRAGLRQSGTRTFCCLPSTYPSACVTRLRDVLGYHIPSLPGLDCG